jgi:NADP-dependent 3-hydroxy acid dehydrogenase YdfG
VTTDVTDAEAVVRLAAKADECFGGIDVWINNAGTGVFGAYQDADIALHRRTVEVNLLGTMNGSHAVLSIFLRQKRGILINKNRSAGGRLHRLPRLTRQASSACVASQRA